MFQDGMKFRRCLIPAAGYYEWDHAQPKAPKLFFSRSDAPHLLLAGIYRLENDRKPSFTILTREPTEALRVFHDRMPVILDASLQQDWLSGESADRVLDKAVTQLSWQKA